MSAPDRLIFWLERKGHRALALDAIGRAPDSTVVVVRPPSRSLAQNDRLHAMLTEIAASLDKYLADNKKSINWLKKNAPDQHERFQTAYSNAAEAAGIKKEEPKRKDFEKPADPAPQETPPASGQGHSPPAPEGSGSNPVAAPPPAQKPMTLKHFSSTKLFLEAFEYFIEKDDHCNPATCKQWLEFYVKEIGACETSQHKENQTFVKTLVDMARGIAATPPQP